YQSDVTGEMNTVTYTAKKEYHFEEFATVSENGVTVSRIDSKTVMVSGTPTADVSITVPDATKGAYADYFVTDGDSYTTVNEKKVRFGGHEWFVIDDDSTGENKGTLTLLSAECLGVSKFNEDSFAGNHYSESDIRAAVLNLLETDNDLKAVSSAMNALAVTTDVKNHDTGEPTQDITDGDKLWLLSIDEANDISALVRECGDASGAHSNRWWLRSPGSSTSEEDAATVSGEDGAVDSSGWTVHYIFGIRPALQLDLSKVDFKKDYNTFVLLDTYIVEVSGGGNTSVAGSKIQIGVSGAMETVTYTAQIGYHFDEFDDIVQNGVTVKRIDNKTVTVTGTPTADVKIDVPDAIDDLAGAYYRLCVNEEDTLESLANKKVIFGGHEWYVLEDNSTAKNEGTLTLFAVECFGASQFNTSENYTNDYEDSLVRTAVLNLLETDEGLKAVSDAIIPVDVTQMKGNIDANISAEATESSGNESVGGDKLWLLSLSEASNLSVKVLFCAKNKETVSNYNWWLRTRYDDADAYYVFGIDDTYGEICGCDFTEECGIRPALRLDLSAVDFDSVTRTFSLAQQAKPVEPEIITDPSAKTLTFNEQAQELITAGEASGGTFVYVVTTENTAPTADLYSESIPKGTNAGTYYVWYMVKGNGNHSNTEAASLPVTIAKAAPDFTQPENKTLTCAQKLSNITLPTGFALKQADQTLSFGDNTVTLTYTPSDTTNYKKVETDIVVTVSNHNLTKTNAFQPSCSKTGNCEYWTCSVCNRHFSDALGKTEIQETDIVIPRIAHTPSEAVSENSVPATCETEGSYDEVVRCSDCGELISTTHKTTEPLGHRYGDPVYTWSADGKTCTAKAVCQHDAGHVVTEEATITAKVTLNPTQNAKGKTTYTAFFTKVPFTTQTKVAEDIEALPKTESTGTSNPATTPDPDKTEEKDQPADFGTPITSLEDNAEVVVISGKDEKPAVEYKGSTDKEAKDVTVPDTVTDGKVTYDVVEIADNAFKGNKTVERVKIGKNIKKISENAFSGCTKLKYVDLSQSGVEIIDKNAFNGTKIKTVTLPDTLKEVRSGAFSGCKSLTTITFGKNTRSFGKDVLKNSGKVRTVIFKANKVPTPKNLKNLVKSLKNKKATIKVQKKLYSKYRTALKKAGFKGKVKKIK
ncbi:MAG: leucine-rich repeat domain-containing protein, partial [Lachnospiraceae bacterium]|nr:leucine-rich repeat domain-containing protein [Lachnospiraceae bacterium]